MPLMLCKSSVHRFLCFAGYVLFIEGVRMTVMLYLCLSWLLQTASSVGESLPDTLEKTLGLVSQHNGVQ